MAKIKICGLSRSKDIKIVNLLLPDFIGFVFAQGSKRRVDEESAATLKANLHSSVKAVGVFVNEAPERIIRLCRSNIIDIVQLHGEEGEEYIKDLKKQIPNKIIKAVRVRKSEDISQASELPCDYLLLDTYLENEYGGSGMVFDWSLITKSSKPFFLAGGIQTDNVIQAIQRINPYCIDVSSGVETNGVKDPMKMIDMITKTKSTYEIRREEY